MVTKVSIKKKKKKKKHRNQFSDQNKQLKNQITVPRTMKEKRTIEIFCKWIKRMKINTNT